MSYKYKLLLNMSAVLISIISIATHCYCNEQVIDIELMMNLLDSNEYEKASIEIEKAFKIDPKCDFCYFAQGYILEKQGQQSEAMKNYNKAIELSPDKPPYYYYRGNLYTKMNIFQNGEFNEENYNRGIKLAIVDFTKGIQLKPWNIDLFYRERSKAYIYISEYDNALIDLQKLLQLNKKDTSLLCDIGKCYLELNDPDNALEFLLEAKTNEMSLDFCIVDIALSYSMKNEKDKALKYLEMAVSRDEFTARYGINKSDPRWDNIRETTIFQKVKNSQKAK